MVVYTCNLNTRGESRRIVSSRPAWAIHWEFGSNTTHTCGMRLHILKLSSLWRFERWDDVYKYTLYPSLQRQNTVEDHIEYLVLVTVSDSGWQWEGASGWLGRYEMCRNWPRAKCGGRWDGGLGGRKICGVEIVQRDWVEWSRTLLLGRLPSSPQSSPILFAPLELSWYQNVDWLMVRLVFSHALYPRSKVETWQVGDGYYLTQLFALLPHTICFSLPSWETQRYQNVLDQFNRKDLFTLKYNTIIDQDPDSFEGFFHSFWGSCMI
jgi:hypothetical protein